MSSWLRCDCGNLIHTNLFTGTGIFKLVLDEDFDRLVEPFDAEAVHDLFWHGHTVYRCRPCGRLYVQWARGGELTVYLPEPPSTTQAPGT